MNNRRSQIPPEQKCQIQLVDDKPENLKILRTILTNKGYEVRAAINGTLALNSIRQQPPEIVLLDIRMPDIDGYEVCRQLKSDEKTRDIPIIFLSVLNDVTDKVKGFEVGAIDYITKPFQEEEVLARVETHLKLRQLQKQLEEQNDRLQQEIQERHRSENEKETLNVISQLFLSSESLTETYTALAKVLATRFQFPIVAIELYDRDRKEMVFVGVAGVNSAPDCPLRVPIDQTISGTVATTGKPVFEANARRHFKERSGVLKSLDMQTFLCVPMHDRHQIFGTLSLADCIERQEAKCLIDTLQAIANYLAQEIERKQASEKLKESERRYHALAEAILVGMFQTDDRGHCTYVNERWQEITGLTMEEAKHTGWIQTLHPDDRERVVKEWYRAAQNNTPFQSEHRFQRRDGVTTWVLGQARAETDDRGKVIGYVGTVTDITARKHVETEQHKILKQLSEMKYALDRAAIVAIISDRGLITYINDKFRDFSGYKTEELIGRKYDLMNSSERSRQLFKKIRSTLLKGDVWQGEMEVRAKDGTYFWLDTTVVPFLNDRNKPWQYLAICWDITSQKQTRNALSKLNRELEQRVAQRTCELQQSNQKLKAEIKQRQQAETELLELNTALQNALEGIARLDTQGRYISVNRAYASQYGYETAETLGMNHEQLIYFDDLPILRSACKKMLSTEKAEVEIRGVRKNGSIFYQHLTMVKAYNKNGIFNGRYYFIKDVSYRKQAEEALRVSEERFRTLLSNIPGAIYRCQCNTDWTMEFISDAVFEISGYPSSDFIQNHQRSYASIIYPDDRKIVRDSIQQAITVKQPFIIEYRIVNRKSQIRWVYEKGQGVFDKNGDLLYLDGAIFDISNRKEAEYKTLKNREFLHHIIDANPNLIFVKDRAGRYTLANQAIAEIHETTVDNLIGKTDLDLMQKLPERSTLKTNDSEIISEISNSLNSKRNLEEKITSPKGEIRYFQTTTIPIIDPNSQVPAILGVATDITKRKQAELKMQDALDKERELNHLKTQFIDIASHEFRTPLTSIIGSAEFLIRHSNRISEDKKYKHLNNIYQSGLCLNDLVNDILVISRAESNKIEFQPTSIDLILFCSKLVEELKMGIGKDRKIQQKISGKNPRKVRLDAKLLQHILSNLLSNAIKYSQQGCPVELFVHCQERVVQFEIRDRGIGIPAEDRSHIFESFHRAKNVGQIPGTGLGLNIVRKYINLHGGSISFSSQVGVGTTFSVTLPQLDDCH